MSELSGIQLQFSHGVKSPFYETQWAKHDQVKQAWVDNSRKIKQVSMLVTGFDTLSVMRLTDDRGMTIIELVWKSAVTATNSEASDEEGTRECESDG